MSNPGAAPSLPAGVVVLERGWLSSNNILLVGNEATALVDSGYATHAEQTLALVASALCGRALDLLVNTHLHSDHCGGNAELQRTYPGLRTMIPPGQAQEVMNWDAFALTYVPTGQQCEQFGFDDLLRPGIELKLGHALWEVHAAPGHDPHSIVLFEPITRTLISADALWERGFGVVFPELEGCSGFDEVAQTLDLIESLSPCTVIPGHGSIFHDTTAALAIARSRLESFVRQPLKHARHAAKVLIKFKLLELNEVELGELVVWSERTAYLETLRRTWYPDLTMGDWVGALTDELVAGGAATREGSRLANT